ncbi:T9SS type A sorting domain-containing protein [uncultured Winogradskyella sp.]|uniref:beta-xylosidase family glycoside hydrolase n=1 Tax=uncultured Winogradskyella sp. TaxID=395353 RepID=UPI003512A653
MKSLMVSSFKALIFLLVALASLQNFHAQSPVIDIWYGDTQEYGNNGEPQVWCNILGNVSDTDAGSITSLNYSLNGGSTVDLEIGPDNRRLENIGDFNVDLNVNDLVPGSNTVEITAIDNDSNTTTKTVTINYTDGNLWPIPYTIDWSSLNDITEINNVSHVVDGKFELTANGIRTAEPGYDRLIALGDKTSTNYEVLVPITIHSMPGDGGVGVLLRWKGHTAAPVSCDQPQCGWVPNGAISWFRANRLEFYQGNSESFTPQLEVTYMFRTSVDTDAATGSTNYRIKFWEQGTPEPTAWNLEQTEGSSNLQEGSLMLIAHKADVTFGDVIVTPGSLSITNVQTQLANNNTEATITWTTNQPTTSRIDYGITESYVNFVEDLNLVTSHSVTLTGLTPETIYQYQISGLNAASESIATSNRVLSTFTSGIVSDDFCDNTLNPAWTFDNPLGDANYQLTGSGTSDAFLEISVPAGTEHEIYDTGIQAPNLMQTMSNTDFEVEVKFESGVVAPQYQEQGILVKESDTRYLRFEFYSKNDNQTYVYSQAFNLPTFEDYYVNTPIYIEGTAPLYMRVKREGNQWTLSYSDDGTNFTVGASFVNDLVPTEIGPYAGNAIGNNSPAHTAKIDYFLNLDDPIITEDGCNAPQSPVLAEIGNQSIIEGSSLPLTLSATDGDGNDADIVFSESGLPSFATLTNNNDGTATLSIDPQLGDFGTYTVTITVTDSDGLTDEETFDIIVSSGTISSLVSDDFCDDELNPVWTFVDPQLDGSFALSGSGTSDAYLEISVPGGSEHQMWTAGIQAPHVIQACNNTDFEIEVKLDSGVNAPQYQEQGILIKQDESNFLRFEFYSTNSNTIIYAAVLAGATVDEIVATQTEANTIGSTNIFPLYMRVKREGDLWTQTYSFDGQNWLQPNPTDPNSGVFTHAMTVTSVGLYSGNALSNGSPAHMAQFDYFKNLADPIVNEDSCCITTTAATWNGSVSSDWNDQNNWTPAVVPSICSELTIPTTTNAPEISGDVTVKDAVLNSGANMVVPAGTTLTITGDLTMFSDSDTFSGLVVYGDATIEGTTKYHRYTNANLSGNGNDLIAPPLAGQTWSSFLTNDSNHNANTLLNDGVAVPNTQYLFGPFEKGATDDYIIYNHSDDVTLLSGIGYRAGTNTAQGGGNGDRLIFTGQLLTTALEVDITDELTGAFHQWNLIGNPYPAYLDVEAFLNHEVSPGVTNLSLLTDPEAAIYGYNSSENGSIWSVVNLVDGPRLIAPGQGFFVSSKNQIGQIEFTKDMQVSGDSDDFIAGRSTQELNFMKLKASASSASSIISIYFHENGTSGLDAGYDAAAFGGIVPDFSLFSQLVDDNEGLPMVVQTLNAGDVGNAIIPLAFYASQGQQVNFSIEEIQLPPNIEVYLEDNVNNTFTLLNTSDYIWTTESEINGAGRFFLHFSSGALSIEEALFESLNIYVNQNERNIIIEGEVPNKTSVSVYDLLGREVLTQDLDSSLNKQSLDVSTISSSVYIVKLNNNGQELRRKVILR